MKKIALITGASRGIGSAISDFFASQGYDLHLTAKNRNNLENKKNELEKNYENCHVSIYPFDQNSPEETSLFCQETLLSMPTPDVFVASAGIMLSGTLDTDKKDLHQLYQVNVLSTIELCNAVSQRMKEKGSGYIFILGSNAASIHLDFIGSYASTKAAINHYAETLFNIMVQHNVKVTCLNPSLVNTDMIRDGLTFDPQDVIQPEDLVKTVEWLLALSHGAAVPSLRVLCTPLAKERTKIRC